MGPLSGKTTLGVLFLLFFSEGVNSQVNNLLLQEQIVYFKSRPHFGSVLLSSEASRMSQKLFFLVKMEKKDVYPFT